jgi:hypothetical protein
MISTGYPGAIVTNYNALSLNSSIYCHIQTLKQFAITAMLPDGRWKITSHQK